MEKILRGKYLVRKAKTTGKGKNKKNCIIVTGMFFPINFDINSINDNDEMWVSDLIIGPGGIRFTNPIGIDGGSPEDFLNGDNTSPLCWGSKEELK